MNTRSFTLVVSALVGFFAAAQPALAASKKADARAAALVAALQAVSPDPLGGRLGLALTAPRGEVAPVANTTTTVRGLTAQTDRDQRDYLVWKKSQKS